MASMAIQLHLRLLLLAAVLTAPFSARAITTTGQYTLTILGRVQHNYLYSNLQAVSINDHGVVAGNATLESPEGSLTFRGVLWHSSSPHYTILGTLVTISGTASEQSAAYWINNSGIAAGQSLEDKDHGGTFVPVIFTPNGIVNLGLKKPAFSGFADCINNYGQVVGCLFFPAPSNAVQPFLYQKGSNPQRSGSFGPSNSYFVQAFLYQNGVMTLLGYPTNAPSSNLLSAAVAINDSGLIVGYAVFASGQPTHAACYTNGAWVDLGTLGPPDAFEGYANSVNDSGTIVGTWYNDNGSGCFIYQNGRMTDLHAPNRPGEPFINNAGQIVLGNFIYQNGVWQDINDLDLGDGWKFWQALGINNQGAIIGYVFREIDGLIFYYSALLTPVSPNQEAATRTP
jgi:probable HAF family extracellular repeat protein